MFKVYNHITKSAKEKKPLLAVLLDPDKLKKVSLKQLIRKLNDSLATHIFVGGSEVDEGLTEELIIEVKKHTTLPVVIFPGDILQISSKADALLFLSLISGRNPDYLIGKHIEAVSTLKNTKLETIPTGYLLIENGKQTSVERVSKTKPLKRNDKETIIDTAIAGQLLGMKLIYLEAGSGATHPIDPEIIAAVKKNLNIPLIVGGGIRNKETLENSYKAGADLVVIGTAFEEDESFFEYLKK